MKNNGKVMLILAAAIVIFGGLAWLASSPMMPVTQKVELSILDEHIPR
jgi:hypothetical protein